MFLSPISMRNVGQLTALLATAALASAAGLDSLPVNTTDCSDVHIFLAKGWSEQYPGRQGPLVTAVCRELESCDYEDIVWNNGMEDNYCKAIYQGATNGYEQVLAYNLRCPDTLLVLSGFSQGAQVVGDFLGGGGGTFFGCTEEDTPSLMATSPAGQKIKAILTWGDVRHTKNQPYNFQTGASGQGMYPRDDEELVKLNTWARVWRDYCVALDPVCAGGYDIAIHTQYFEMFTETAAKWVQKQVIKAGARARGREDESGDAVAATDGTADGDDASSSSATTTSSSSAPSSPLPSSSSTSDDSLVTGSMTIVQRAAATSPLVRPPVVLTITVMPESTDIPTRNLTGGPATTGPGSPRPTSSDAPAFAWQDLVVLPLIVAAAASVLLV